MKTLTTLALLFNIALLDAFRRVTRYPNRLRCLMVNVSLCIIVFCTTVYLVAIVSYIQSINQSTNQPIKVIT